MKYKPAKVEELPGYVWYCAFAECMAKEYILPSMIYDQLSYASSRESQFYRGKWYKTEELAMKALKEAFGRLGSDIVISYRNLPIEKQAEIFPELQKVFNESQSNR